jgi:hypothetical protein
MRSQGAAPRIGLVFDDEMDQRRFFDHFGPATRVQQVAGCAELVKLGRAGLLDAVIASVLHRHDPFLPEALKELHRSVPDLAIVGVFDSTRPSLDEAVDLARRIPGIGFVRAPGARLDYLIRRRPEMHQPATFTRLLLDCMERLPLFGPALRFARLQALHPSFAAIIPDQAKELGLSRRNLERWFQGPDLCSAGCFQSVCAAGEGAYLRSVLALPAREVAPVVGILTREGVENPQAVPRTIRNALHVGLHELRAGGVPALLHVIETALRTPRDPIRAPAQWEPDARFVPREGVVLVPKEDRALLMDTVTGEEILLNSLGTEAWPLLAKGNAFAGLIAQMAAARHQPASAIRAQLIAWLSELLVRGLVRRERAGLKAANGD